MSSRTSQCYGIWESFSSAVSVYWIREGSDLRRTRERNEEEEEREEGSRIKRTIESSPRDRRKKMSEHARENRETQSLTFPKSRSNASCVGYPLWRNSCCLRSWSCSSCPCDAWSRCCTTSWTFRMSCLVASEAFSGSFPAAVAARHHLFHISQLDVCQHIRQLMARPFPPHSRQRIRIEELQLPRSYLIEFFFLVLLCSLSILWAPYHDAHHITKAREFFYFLFFHC